MRRQRAWGWAWSRELGDTGVITPDQQPLASGPFLGAPGKAVVRCNWREGRLNGRSDPSRYLRQCPLFLPATVNCADRPGCVRMMCPVLRRSGTSVRAAALLHAAPVFFKILIYVAFIFKTRFDESLKYLQPIAVVMSSSTYFNAAHCRHAFAVFCVWVSSGKKQSLYDFLILRFKQGCLSGSVALIYV